MTENSQDHKLVLRRITSGIKDHFKIRMTEWVMLWPFAFVAAIFYLIHDIFNYSASFSTLERWGDEHIWALIVTACCSFRLFALVVNGTFHSFRYSPHIRAGASIFGILFWGLFTTGFAFATTENPSAWFGVAFASCLCLMEFINWFRSNQDIVYFSGD